ncbi:MAG: AraC family transcriptional regulator [Ruminococcaceae bacterium]|nr:AraC family transcriptional regulator [Oscillospiraceae bacterium]
MSQHTSHFSIMDENFKFNHSYIPSPNNNDFCFHTHDNTEILFIKRANGCHVIEDREYPLSELDLVLVPPATYHHLRFYDNSPYERYNVICTSEFYSDIDIQKVYRNITVINCTHHNIITDIFKKADYYVQVLPPKDCKQVLKLLIKELFFNLSIYDGTAGTQPNFVSSTLSRAIEFINENLYNIETVSDVSNALYITDSYLYEIFKTQLKTSPKKYITAKRLHSAKNALSNGEKPMEVYGKFGFGDYASFYRSYVRFFGHSPSEEKEAKFTDAKFGM